MIFAYLGASLFEYHQHMNDKVCKPELPCPDCEKPTVLFGFARLRKLIVDGIPQRNALRRVRCKNCEKTLSLLS